MPGLRDHLQKSPFHPLLIAPHPMPPMGTPAGLTKYNSIFSFVFSSKNCCDFFFFFGCDLLVHLANRLNPSSISKLHSVLGSSCGGAQYSPLVKQVSTAYLPSLCTNASQIWFSTYMHLVSSPNLLLQVFLQVLWFPPASKPGLKWSKFWSEGPSGNQWLTLSVS